MKNILGILAVWTVLNLWGFGADKVAGCLAGQTCSLNAQVTVVNNCFADDTDSYCIQDVSQEIFGCSSESDFPSCSAFVFGRYTSCSSVADNCQKTGRDIQVSCCSGSGGGGGPTPIPQCPAPQVVVPYSPPQIVCVATCRNTAWGPGIRWVDGYCDEDVACGHNSNGDPKCLCEVGFCGSACTPACGNTTNGCGYETFGCAGSCAPNTGACFWPARVNMTKELIGSGSLPTTPMYLDALDSGAVNPYTFNLPDTIQDNIRNASVSIETNYDIGHSLCYNNTTCHTVPNITPGVTKQVLDNGIRNLGANSANPYADLYWHYCPKITTPVQNIQPNGREQARVSLP